MNSYSPKMNVLRSKELGIMNNMYILSFQRTKVESQEVEDIKGKCRKNELIEHLTK